MPPEIALHRYFRKERELHREILLLGTEVTYETSKTRKRLTEHHVAGWTAVGAQVGAGGIFG